jgi:hypothetical protein
MPAAFERDGVQFLRPLLAVPGPDLRQWLLQQGHAFVDDPSNTDERYTRNRIRARLLPALAEAFPQFRQTFARSASHAAEAQTLLSEMAAQDLLLVGTPPAIAALQALSRPRQSNVLRHWLLGSHQARPSAAQLPAPRAATRSTSRWRTGTCCARGISWLGRARYNLRLRWHCRRFNSSQVSGASVHRLNSSQPFLTDLFQWL